MADGRDEDALQFWPLPADTSKDTTILWRFRPSDLPFLTCAVLLLAVSAVLPVPTWLRLLAGPCLAAAVLAALLFELPSKLRRRARRGHDIPAAYRFRASDVGGVRVRWPDGRMGLTMAVLPPPEVGVSGSGAEAERVAWVRALRRLKAARSAVAVSAELVPDTPPQPGWVPPADLELPPGAARVAEMRAAHFAARVADGRALRPQVALRMAGPTARWGAQPDLYLDRLANGLAGELSSGGALAVPLALDALEELAALQERVFVEPDDRVGAAGGVAAAAVPSLADEGFFGVLLGAFGAAFGRGRAGAAPSPAVAVPPHGSGTVAGEPLADSSIGESTAGAPAVAPRVPVPSDAVVFPVGVPILRFPWLPHARPAPHPSGASYIDRLWSGVTLLPVGSARRSVGVDPPDPDAGPGWDVSWPDLDALYEGAGRTWDVGLAVLGALPRVGASTALAAWSCARPDADRWALLDANTDRPGGLALAAGVAPDGTAGWRAGGGGGGVLTHAGWGTAVIGQGPQPDGGDLPGGDPHGSESHGDPTGALVAAVRRLRERGGVGQVALDLGSPPALTERLRAHPLVRLAAEGAAAVAVVTRQDEQALFAARRLLNCLSALGAAEVRVWVAAYDTSDPVTLAELRAAFRCPVEEAPSFGRRPVGVAEPLAIGGRV